MSESREGFAHEVALAFPPDEDQRAPGGAITIELCGSTDHEPPCPFAVTAILRRPHHAWPDVRVSL